jgi:hypothetical protein
LRDALAPLPQVNEISARHVASIGIVADLGLVSFLFAAESQQQRLQKHRDLRLNIARTKPRAAP